MRQRPEHYGLLPDGITEEEARRDAEAPAGAVSMHTEIDFTVKEALTSAAFWQLGVGFGLRNMLSSAVLIHLIAAVVDRGHSEAFGATVLAIMAAISIPSRIISGLVQDRIEKRKVGAAVGVVTSLSLAFYLMSDSLWALGVFAALFAVAWGAASPTQQAIRGEYFGRLHYAKINGFANLFMTAGSVAGPAIAGYVHDAVDTYDPTFLGFAAISLVSGVVIWHARRPTVKSAAPPGSRPAITRPRPSFPPSRESTPPTGAGTHKGRPYGGILPPARIAHRSPRDRRPTRARSERDGPGAHPAGFLTRPPYTVRGSVSAPSKGGLAADGRRQGARPIEHICSLFVTLAAAARAVKGACHRRGGAVREPEGRPAGALSQSPPRGGEV